MRLVTILLVALLGGLSGLHQAGAETVDVGDTRESVVDALGKPDGTVILGDTEVLYYKRGQVDIRNGKVVTQSIVSEAEAEAIAEKRREEEKKYFAAMERKKAERRAAAQQAAAAAKEQAAEAELSPEDLRKKAKIEAKIQEGLKDPPVKTSAGKLRKYRRGRSQSAVAAREVQLRKQYEED